MATITVTFTNTTPEEVADAQHALAKKNAERVAAGLPPLANPVAMLIDHIANEYQPYLRALRESETVPWQEYRERWKLSSETVKASVEAFIDANLAPLP